MSCSNRPSPSGWAVFELAGQQARKMVDTSFGDRTLAEAAEHVMAALAVEPPALPRIDD